MMKKLLVVVLVASLVPAVFGELAQNSDFSAGLDSWSTWSSYTWSVPFAMNDPCTGDDLVRMCGWGYNNASWGCTAVWQNTGATFQADTEYTLTVEWRDPSSAVEIVETVGLSLANASTWADVAADVYGPAAAEDEWTTAILTFDTATDPGLVGEGIGVGFRATSGTLAWVDINSISLVPEPASMALLGFGSMLMLRRRKA